MNSILTPISVASLGATAAMACLSVIIGMVLAKHHHKSSIEKWILIWLVYDAMTHFLLEGSFVYLSLTGTVEKSSHFTAILWKEYGKADSRWLVSDPTIVALEILTVFVVGTLCLVLIYAICKNTFYRHYIQLVVCVSELYGGWMTFCPEWLTGSPSLRTDNALYLWVYLVFFNGIWVVVPALLMWQSWNAMKPLSKSTKAIAGGDTEKRRYNLRSKKTD